MAVSKHLAFDFGAESGRAVIGTLKDGILQLQEIHRFPNVQHRILGHIYWDVLQLFAELKKGLSIAAKSGHDDIVSIGVDTWGIDFGLFGKDGQLLGLPHSYRDDRTNGIMEKVFERVPREDIYAATGIGFMKINSLYQLYSVVINEPAFLDECETLLFTPDIFNYFLTGKMMSEYTIASTSQMLNASTKMWNDSILIKLGIPQRIMPEVAFPGTVVGEILPDILSEAGIRHPVDVIAVGSHDTASAVASVPATSDDWAFISSGTWSPMGLETKKPYISGETIDNFTNEGGVGGSILFLKNVVGLWLLQEARKSLMRNGERLEYDELVSLASAVDKKTALIDTEDASFLNPDDMCTAIRDYCRRLSLPVPGPTGEIVKCILESLAAKYSSVIEKIRSITGKKISVLHVIGGGSQNDLLNRMTADKCGLPVVAGPVEATAIGNIMVQAIARGCISNPAEGREIVMRSFKPKTVLPA